MYVCSDINDEAQVNLLTLVLEVIHEPHLISDGNLFERISDFLFPKEIFRKGQMDN